MADPVARREVCVQQRVSDWVVEESGAGGSGSGGRRGQCWREEAVEALLWMEEMREGVCSLQVT